MAITTAFKNAANTAVNLSQLARASYKGPGKTTVKIGNKTYATPEFGITEKSGVTSKTPMTVTITKDGISSAPTKSSNNNTKKKSGGSGGSGGSKAPSAPSEMDLFAQQEGLSKNAASLEAQRLQNEYDYTRELLGQQESSATKERDIAKSQLELALQDVVKSGSTSKQNAQIQAETATEQGASAARQATTKTRNMLRGLGILSSSAGSDLLSRPATEFQKVSADIQTQLGQRVKEVDDFISSKTQENALKVQELLNNYASIVDRIRTDLRFNNREKLSALKQNKLALDQTLSEIRANQTNFMLQANTYKNNLLSGASQYNTPLATTGAQAQQRIAGTVPTIAPKTQTKDMYTGVERKKIGTDLLSSFS